MERSRRAEVLQRAGAVAVLVAHATVMVLAVAVHEPWFDEAQAWLIARDAGTTEIITRYGAYEGTPVLWHLLLSVPAKLGLPYQSLGIISGTCAVVAAGVLLLRSPLPGVVKVMIPFSYWITFQYGTVSRSYALLAPLLFTIAALWPERQSRPVALFGLLILLANVSAHGFLVAGALAGLHCAGMAVRRKELDRPGVHVAAAAVFAAVAIGVVLQVLPPDDITFHGAQPREYPDAVGALQYAAEMVDGALTEIPALSALAMLISAAWFARTRCLLLWLVPSGAVLALSTFQYGNVWHQGILALVWIFALWVSFQGGAATAVSPVLRASMLGALVAVLAVQVSWTVRSVDYDVRRSYSGGTATAALVEGYPDRGGQVTADGFSVTAIQPYFDENRFANYHPGEDIAFWFWSTRRVMTEPDLGRVPASTIVAQDKAARRPWPNPPPTFVGYRLDAHVRGALWFKDRVLEQEGFYVYRRSQP